MGSYGGSATIQGDLAHGRKIPFCEQLEVGRESDNKVKLSISLMLCSFGWKQEKYTISYSPHFHQLLSCLKSEPIYLFILKNLCHLDTLTIGGRSHFKPNWIDYPSWVSVCAVLYKTNNFAFFFFCFFLAQIISCLDSLEFSTEHLLPTPLGLLSGLFL